MSEHATAAVEPVRALWVALIPLLPLAGAVLLGKLNLTEGATAGYSPKFDVPRNPWNLDYWPGLSSSGSGVAVAAGLCFGATGTDTGGSIRFPSSACGIVGLKPTYGRVSRYGVLTFAESLDHVGPMARTVADAAIMLGAMEGFDPNDAATTKCTPPPGRDYQQFLRLTGLRKEYPNGFVAVQNLDLVIPRTSFGDAITVLLESGCDMVDRNWRVIRREMQVSEEQLAFAHARILRRDRLFDFDDHLGAGPDVFC